VTRPVWPKRSCSVHATGPIAYSAAACRCAAKLVGMFLCVFLSSVITAFTSASAAGVVPVVTDARVSNHEEATRITFSVSAPVRHRVFTLARPDRVVIDLPDVRWQLTKSRLLKRSGLFEGMRLGRFKPGSSRVVIDCHSPVIVRDPMIITSGTGGYRLIMDLIPAKRTDGAPISTEVGPSPPPIKPATTDGPKIGGAISTPMIGATGLAIGDVGREPGVAGMLTPARAGVANSIFAFAPPKPRPPMAGAVPAAQWIVAIDAGHGGQDPGAISLSGVYEKQITLAMARALREELKDLRRYKAVLTRNNDKFIRLRDRVAIAQAAGADLLVSLHADKMQSRVVRGLSVYTLSERASDAEAAALAERENKVDLIGGVKLVGETPEVTNILIDLIQRETMNDSAQVASILVSELDKATLLLPRTHRFAGFAVLKAPDVPSVLIELGYLSNPADERLLLSTERRRKLARGIARAIDGYFVRVEARNQ
jgi:N-acetylmuramoyl-L-alanine amidase